MFYTILTLQIVTVLYHQLTTLFDFFPFNGVRNYTVKERRNEALMNGIIMVIPIILTLTHNPILIGIGAAVWTLVVVGGFLSWWLPYITGHAVYKMPNNETWSQVYERIFAEPITILPRIKNNPRPNVEHMILHAFILASAITTWMYTFHI
jgi:hypothetical protein